MLIDKIEPQMPSTALSVQTSTAESQNGRYSVTRLPRISNTPSSYSAVFTNDSITSSSRPQISIPSLEKISASVVDHPMGRGPKIYKKNLPEVFTSVQPGSRQKKSSAGLERSKEDNGDQLAIQLATPPNSHFFAKNNKYHQPFISPARLAHLPSSKAKRRLNPHFDLFPLSMKENIEELAIKLGDMSPSRPSHKRTDNSRGASPSRRIHKPAKRSNTEFPTNNENDVSGRNDVSTREEEIKKQIKKFVIFKKKASNTSESKFFLPSNEELKLKMMEKISAPNMTPILQLNELITIKKVKDTAYHGIMKRMLHVPSFRIFDIMEESISELGSHENYELKSWMNNWKMHFVKSKHVAKIYSCFWNSPEGKMSIACEPFKNGSLNDLLGYHGSLPEKAIQTVAKEVLTGIIEIQSKLHKPHGNMTLEEIVIDSNGTIKVSPGVSHSSSSHSGRSKSPRSFKDNILRPSLRFPPNHDERSPSSASSHRSEFAQDIFNLGLIILQCALGDLSFYEPGHNFTFENLKNVFMTSTEHKRTEGCCLLHSEDLARKMIAVNASNGPIFGKKADKILQRKGLKPLSDDSAIESAPLIPLYEALTSVNQFSEVFVDFLCGCLKLDPEQRFTSEDLLDHEFLNEYHGTKGPQVSFQELLSVYKKSLKAAQKGGESEEEKELYKLGEALRVVFLNKHVKDKFDLMVSRNFKGELDEKKIMELADELGVSTQKLKRKLTDCLKDL